MKRLFFLAACAVISLGVHAGAKYRAVVIDTVCNAPLSEMQKTAERFCRQFQSCPDSLFEWAYVDLKEDHSQKKTKESKSVIELEYKDRTYDPKTMTGDVAIDIYVLSVRWWKDTHLGTRCTHSVSTKAPYTHTSHLTASYSGSLLEGGNCIIALEPITPTTTRVHYVFDLTFGRVLATFISDKIWHNAIEWRFGIILSNLIEYAETGTVVPKRED